MRISDETCDIVELENRREHEKHSDYCIDISTSIISMHDLLGGCPGSYLYITMNCLPFWDVNAEFVGVKC